MVDAGRALPEPAHRVRRQLDPQRRAPHARSRPRRHRVAAAVGGGVVLARVRGLLFTTGALGDRYGRKGALQFGLATFFLASLLASQATETTQIIACRAAMGVGAAFIMPSTLSILVNVFPPRERAKAIAIWATTTGVAGSIGPVISGYVLGHFWFGSVFLVNLPVIALAFVGGWFLVPKSRDPDESRIDPIGALLSIVGMSAVVYGFIQAPGGRVDRARHARRVRHRRRGAHRVRVLGAAHRRADARHALLPQPRVQRRQRRHDARVPGDVRRDVAHDAVLPARARLLGARHRGPPAADRADHARSSRRSRPASSTASARTARSRSACCWSRSGFGLFTPARPRHAVLVRVARVWHR